MAKPELSDLIELWNEVKGFFGREYYVNYAGTIREPDSDDPYDGGSEENIKEGIQDFLYDLKRIVHGY